MKKITIIKFALLAVFAGLMMTASASAATYTVTLGVDNQNNGCDANCTLREAITAANATPDDVVIEFNLTLPSTITLNAATAQLVIANNGSLTINGAGANALFVSGDTKSTVFEISSGAVVEINNLTITAGKEPTSQNTIFGGGIFNNGGTLTLQNSVVSDSVSQRNGGGIFNGVGVLNVINSTVSGNSSQNLGGGIYNNRGIATLSNVTVSGNSSTNQGGGISNASTQSSLTIYSSTISDNTSVNLGGGINNVSGNALYIYNTIIANNSVTGPNSVPTSADCYNSAVAKINYTLIGVPNGGCSDSQNAANNLSGDPNLGALTINNGGSTPTHALLPGSIAIDQGNSTLSTDQRGFIRPIDLTNVANATGGNGADMGAYEFQVSATVNSTNDPGDGVCDVAECTLREAIALANASADDDIITFSLIPSSVITLNGTELAIANNGSLTIDGTGARMLTISGNIQSRIFTINPGATAIINNLTVTGGNADQGGGINNNGGSLTLNALTVKSNNSTFAGGGIYNIGALVVNNSTISSNNTPNTGGGIYNRGGTFTMNNSTVSGNRGDFGSGGIRVEFGNQATINSSTISSNTTNGSGGGLSVVDSNSTATLNNSIVANSVSGGDCANTDSGASNTGTINSSYSLIEDGLTCVNGTGSNNLTGDPFLTVLADYGGATVTHGLNLNSPVIDKGSSFGLTTDQRGLIRPVNLASITNGNGDAADIGSYEIQTSELTTTPAGTNVTVIPSTNSQPGAETPDGTPSGDVSLTFGSVTASGDTSFAPILDPTTVGTSPQGYTLLPFEVAYDISTTASTTAPITVCFRIDSVNTPEDFAKVRILHGENGVLVDRTILAPDSPVPDFATRTVCASVNSFSPFVPAIVNAPTAASVSVAGRVRTPNGRGLANAFVTLTDSSGNRRLARTTALGYFHFEDVAAGETYIIQVVSKRYRFTPQVLSINQNITDLELTMQSTFSGMR
ncbi:MAG: choice-of-anchor Q domain-containing protein [Pyrinomonadaceae bacterium]